MPSTEKKSRTAFINPNSLHEKMMKRIDESGYNKKQKSQWICEAIEMFIEYKDAIEQVSYQGKMTSKPDEKPSHEVIYISTELKRKLFDLQIQVKTKFPELDSVQSRIIRAAIRQRILRHR